MQKIRDLKNSKEARFMDAWEIDCLPFTRAFKGKNDERPIFPANLMIVHSESYFILHTNLFDKPEADIQEFTDELINYILKEKIFPGLIKVKRPDLFHGLQNICSDLGIGLEQSNNLKAINYVKRHMEQFFSF